MSTTGASIRERVLLRLDGVGKSYGSQVALDDISLTVERRQFLVLLGPSGSGKTTMLRSVAGIERISSGSIILDGAIVDDGRRMVAADRRDLAMVFQDYALWPHMTARQNVAYALRRRRLAAADTDRRTREMLGRVGLGALTERYPSELSGGEQQRVALARALVSEPRLLLFDEPLSNLDANLRELMRAEIATLVREVGATALYITHDQAEAFALADIVGVLNSGRLVQIDTPENIYTTPATPFVARLTGLAGELPCITLDVDETRLARVANNGVTLLAQRGETLPTGVAARLLVRPAAVRLLAAADDPTILRAEVRDAAFVGRGYEHLVDLSDGTRMTGIFAESRFARGQRVGVQLDPRQCIVFGEAACAVEPAKVAT